MSLTPDELERRRHYITATDVAQIAGRSPWGNAADVYRSKVNGIMATTNAAMQAGTLLEPAVLAWAHGELGGIIAGDWRVHENGINAASLDSMTLDGEPVEAKTSGIVGPGSPHQWGEPGTDEIPEYYLLQVEAQLLVTGAKRAWVPALLGGRGFVMYQVVANERLMDEIQRMSEQFWNAHVVAKSPPEGVKPALETLKHLRREPKSVVDIPTDLVLAYQQAKAAEKAAVEKSESAMCELLNVLGNAEAGKWSGGLVTYYETSRKAYEVAANTYRQIRIKASKKELVAQ